MTFEGHYGDLLTFVTLCAQLTSDLLAIAKLLVKYWYAKCLVISYSVMGKQP